MKVAEIWTAYANSPTYAKDTTARRKGEVEKIWNEYAEACGSIDATEITSNGVADWLGVRCRGCSAKTYNEYLRMIRQVLKAVLSKTGLLVNPAMEVPVKRNHSISRQPYTKQEIAAIVATVETGTISVAYHYKSNGREYVQERPYAIPHPHEVALSILLGAYCGMRLGDAVAVTGSQYADGCIIYTPHKTQTTSGVEVVVPVIHPMLQRALADCQGKLTPHLMEMHRRQPSDLCRLYNRIFEACGHSTQTECKGRRNASTGGYHALRHSYVTWSAEAGVPIDVVASCVGHTSTLTTRIYNHISRSRKASEMARLMTA